MPSIAKQLADLDQRIANVARNLATLRSEMAALDEGNRVYVRLLDIVAITEISLRRMRAQRAELERKPGSSPKGNSPK